MAVPEVVCGTTLKDIVVTLQEESGAAFNLTGATVKLQGRSEEDRRLPTIDQTGTVTAPATAGIVQFVDAGTYVDEARLKRAGLARARFDLRVRVSLAAGAEVDFGPEFQVDWAVGPLVAP